MDDNDGHDIDSLPPTQQYDHQENTYSDEPPLTATTQMPLQQSAAPHSTSSFSSYSPEFSNIDSSSLECDNSVTSVESHRLGTRKFERDTNLVLLEAAHRLFRVRSANTGDDGSTFRGDDKKAPKFLRNGSDSDASIGNKRKHDNLKRNSTELTSLTSNWSQMPHYIDKPRLKGKITSKQRVYFDSGVDFKERLASMDINSISSTAKIDQVPSSDKTDQTLMELDRQFSVPSVDSLDSQYHSSFPSEHTLSSPSASTQTQPSIPELTTEPSYQAETTYPIDDHNAKENLEDEENEDNHLHNYSPVREDDFARQLSKQPSSTPIQTCVPSTFPEADLDTIKQSTEQYETDDAITTLTRPTEQRETNDTVATVTRSNEQYGTDGTDATPSGQKQLTHVFSSRNVSNMPSPFLEKHQNQQQRETRSISNDQKKHTVIPSRRLRSYSFIFDLDAAPIISSQSPPPCIMFASTIDHLKYRGRAEAMGATIVTSWELCTHMVTDSFRRSPNLLCALASQKHIVSEAWIKNSISKTRFEDETSYILRKQKFPNHFAGKKLFFEPSAEMKRADAIDLAKAAGAKLRLEEPNLSKIDSNLVVIYSVDKMDKSRLPYQNAGYETISRKEFLDLYEQSTS